MLIRLATELFVDACLHSIQLCSSYIAYRQERMEDGEQRDGEVKYRKESHTEEKDREQRDRMMGYGEESHAKKKRERKREM